MKHDEAKGGILAKKWLWIGVGASIFLIIAFAIPAPQTLVETIGKYGYVKKMMYGGIAHSTMEAADKAMIILGIVPMAILGYFLPPRPFQSA